MTISRLNKELSKDRQASKELIQSSGTASSIISLLLSSNITVTDGMNARDTYDERHLPHVLEESLAALTILCEAESITRLMTTVEFLSVVTCYLCQGRQDARDNACHLLEKLSLKRSSRE